MNPSDETETRKKMNQEEESKEITGFESEEDQLTSPPRHQSLPLPSQETPPKARHPAKVRPPKDSTPVAYPEHKDNSFIDHYILHGKSPNRKYSITLDSLFNEKLEPKEEDHPYRKEAMHEIISEIELQTLCDAARLSNEAIKIINQRYGFNIIPKDFKDEEEETIDSEEESIEMDSSNNENEEPEHSADNDDYGGFSSHLPEKFQYKPSPPSSPTKIKLPFREIN